MGKHYWIVLYTDGTYDQLYNTREGAMQWVNERHANKFRRLILDD